MRRKGLNKKSLETGGQQLNPAIQDLIQSSRSAIDMGATPKDLVLELSSSNIDSNDIQEVLISLGYTQDDVETIYSEIQEEQQKAQEEAQRQLQQRQQQNVTQYGGNLPQAQFGTLYGLDGRATENVYRDPRRMYDNLPIQMPKSPIDVALNIASDAAFDPSNNFISRNFSKKDRNDDGLMDGRFFDRSAKKARRKLNRANLYDYEIYDKYGAGPDDQGIKIDMNSDNALSDQVKSKFSTNVYDVYDASKTGAPLKSKEQLEQDTLKHSRIDFDTDSGQHFGYMSSRDIEPLLSKNPDLRNPATKASVSFEEYRNRFSPEQKENFIEQIQSMENADDGTTYGVDKEGFGASYAGLKDNPYLYDTMMGLNIENFNRPVVETDSKPPLDLSDRNVSDGPSWQQTQEEAAPLTFKQWYGQNADRLQNMSKQEIQDIYDSEKQEISEFDDYQSDDTSDDTSTSDDGYSFANAINAMLDYEGRAGGFNKATGKAYGLSNLGANKYTDLDPNDPNFREDLVARIDQDYGPLVKDFPNELKGPALDFYYNTGKDPRIYMLDQYLRDEYGDELANRSDYAGMMKDTRWLSPGMQEGFNRTYGQHADGLMGLNPEARLNLMNRGRDFYYQNINRVNNQPNPAYDATWKGRLDLYDPYFQPEMKLGGKIQNMKNRNLAIKRMGDEKKRALEEIPNPLLKSSFNRQIQAVNTPAPKVNFTDSDGDGVADFYDPMTTGKSYYKKSPYEGASRETAKWLRKQGVPNKISRFIPAPKFRYGGLPKAQISPNLDFNKATSRLPLPLPTEKQLMEDAKKNYYRDPATLKLMSNFYSGENKGYNGEPVEVSLSGPDSPNLQLYADSVFSNNWWDTPSGIVTSGTPTAADTANMHFGTTWGDVPDDMPDRWLMSQNAWLVKDTENDSPFYEAIRKGVFPFKRYGGDLPEAQTGIDSNDLDEFDKNVALYKKFSEENPNSGAYDRHGQAALLYPDWAQTSDYIVDNVNKLAPFLNAADAYKEDMFSRMGLSPEEIVRYKGMLANAPIGTTAAGHGNTAVSVAPNYAAGGQPFYDGYEGMLSEADIQRVYAMGGTVEFIN